MQSMRNSIPGSFETSSQDRKGGGTFGDGAHRWVDKPCAALQVIPTDEKVRLVEIGSGSGGTSILVMEALAQHAERVELTYTDISPQLVAYGRRTYGKQFPFVRFHLLDVEKDVVPQVRPGCAAFLPYLQGCFHYPKQTFPSHDIKICPFTASQSRENILARCRKQAKLRRAQETSCKTAAQVRTGCVSDSGLWAWPV